MCASMCVECDECVYVSVVCVWNVMSMSVVCVLNVMSVCMSVSVVCVCGM